MNYNFDLISDIHLDFYIDVRHPEVKMRKHIKEFVDSILLDKQQEVLVISGDLGHYNHQNIFLLEELKNFYKHIIIVSGNHDYYLVSSSVRKRYNDSSIERLLDMKNNASKIENIHHLDGNIIEIEGIKYGGTAMWYDFSYGNQILGTSRDSLYGLWKYTMNDSKLIKGLEFDKDFNEFNKEKLKLERIIDDSDVIITHVGPVWNYIPEQYKFDNTTSFFYFDGSPYFDKIKDKVWTYGHVHYRSDFDFYGCRFVNASLGYPSENTNRKIVNITNDIS